MFGPGDESPDIVDLTTRLVDEFRSRLDESLILPIAGDYDLVISTEWDEARATLLQLAEHAVLEELTGFNHTGVPTADLPSDLEALGPNCGDAQASSTESSPPQTLNSGSSPPPESLSGISEDSDLALFLNTESWSDDRKTAELTAMFPMLAVLDITLALRKTGDFGKAVDELLNIQELEAAGLRQKGIDGFFNPEEADGWAFRKAKKKNRAEASDNGKQKIAVEYSLKPLPAEELEASKTLAASRAQHRPSVRPQLSPSSRPVSSPCLPSPGVSAPSPTGWQKVESKKKLRTNRPESKPETAYSARLETRAGFAAASQAARNSNLHRAYAGILAERALEVNRIARALESEDWDAVVNRNSNSSGNIIDLHGLPVLEGVRIALQRTLVWWESFDEERVKKARQNPFTIITGLGNHSAGGVSRMRQHVWAALERRGWKASTYDGLFVVNGKK